MENEQIEFWQHHHAFNSEKPSIEKQTLIVVIVTFGMMVAEIIFGWYTNSMSLLADGWHMGTHAFALGISLLAYIFARKTSRDTRFTFGSWKVEILGAYTSAIVLSMVGVIMIITSIERVINPVPIHYDQALLVALFGLVVNIFCVFILNYKMEPHDHNHQLNDSNHGHADHDHTDLNLKSAYLHVFADAMTSLMAIAALLGAKFFNWNWLDPFMGIIGAILILRWSVSLIKDTAGILFEFVDPNGSKLIATIQNKIEADGESRVSDLHLWKVAENRFACIVSLVSTEPRTVTEYKNLLEGIPELVHVTIEMNQSV